MPEQVTASVGKPTAIPERPTLYTLLRCRGTFWDVGFPSINRETLDKAAQHEPGSVVVTIPGSAPESEQAKPQSGEDWRKQCVVERYHSDVSGAMPERPCGWIVAHPEAKRLLTHTDVYGRNALTWEHSAYADGTGEPGRVIYNRWLFATEAKARAALATAPPFPDIAPKAEAPQPSTPGAVSDPQQMVRDFHQKFGHPFPNQKPRRPDLDQLRFRRKLIEEEYRELMVEFSAIENILVRDDSSVSDEEWGRLLKEMCDLEYVNRGAAVTFGLPFNAGFSEVHRSNMTKTRIGEPGEPTPKKIAKGPDYQPANMVGVLRENCAW